MSRAGASFLILATLAFVGSMWLHALQPVAADANRLAAAVTVSLSWDSALAGNAGIDLPALFLRPDSPVMAALLGLTCVALIAHALRAWITDRDMRHGAGGGRGHVPVIVGLLAGALWPWQQPDPSIGGFVLVMVMLAGFLAGALQRARRNGPGAGSSALGFAAGWALQAGFWLFAALLHERFGLPPQRAATLAMLAGAVLAVYVQLQLGPRIGFSLALIWGLVGIAAGTVSTDATIATVTVLAIAMIAVALVRVTT